MDIDENTGQGTPPSQPPNGGDVEQFLLHQFSRMGTTDHDELVNQLQKVLGNQLNYNTARFFLDMNNWYVNAFHLSNKMEIVNQKPSTLLFNELSEHFIAVFVCHHFFSHSHNHVAISSYLRLCANVFILNVLVEFLFCFNFINAIFVAILSFRMLVLLARNIGRLSNLLL